MHGRKTLSTSLAKMGLWLLLAVPALTSTGCFYRINRPGAVVVVPAGHPQCRPDQYWDGEICRHKGQGHGARKHDG